MSRLLLLVWAQGPGHFPFRTATTLKRTPNEVEGPRSIDHRSPLDAAGSAIAPGLLGGVSRAPPRIGSGADGLLATNASNPPARHPRQGRDTYE